MAEIVQFPLMVNGLPTGNSAVSEMVQVTFDGSAALTDSLRHTKSGDWSNQEIAELYRVESILLQANIRISTARGVTDENEPWFVFCRENGDVFLHIARIEGEYILDGYGIGSVISGTSFKSLINQFVERSAVREGAENVVQLKRSVMNSDVVRLHPTVMLAALVWTLYLSSNEWMGIAHAADEIAAHPNTVSYQHFSAITNFQAPKSELGIFAPETLGTPKFSSELHFGQKGENRDQFHNFYAFLALHGVALGVPVALADITSPTITVPQQSNFNGHEFQKISTVSFFDLSESEVSHSSNNSTKITAPVVEFKAQLNAQVPSSENNNYFSKGFFLLKNHDTLDKYINIDRNHNEASEFLQKIYVNFTGDSDIFSVNNSKMNLPGVIGDYLSKILVENYFKFWGIEISTTLDYQELEKILPQIFSGIPLFDTQAKMQAEPLKVDFDGSQSLLSIQTSASVPASSSVAPETVTVGASATVNTSSGGAAVANNTSQTAPQTASTTSSVPVVVIGGTSQYNSAANSFVIELIAKPDSVEMLKIGSDIVLVDMSALDEQTDHPYMRTWITDAGFRISTIGHVSDFTEHGLM